MAAGDYRIDTWWDGGYRICTPLGKIVQEVRGTLSPDRTKVRSVVKDSMKGRGEGARFFTSGPNAPYEISPCILCGKETEKRFSSGKGAHQSENWHVCEDCQRTIRAELALEERAEVAAQCAASGLPPVPPSTLLMTDGLFTIIENEPWEKAARLLPGIEDTARDRLMLALRANQMAARLIQWGEERGVYIDPRLPICVKDLASLLEGREAREPSRIFHNLLDALDMTEEHSRVLPDVTEEALGLAKAVVRAAGAETPAYAFTRAVDDLVQRGIDPGPYLHPVGSED